LPFVPVSLIFSRTPFASQVLPSVPLILAWSTSPPVVPRDPNILDDWRHPWDPSSPGNPGGIQWPPSPAFLSLIVFPLVKGFYRKYWTKLTHWVLNTTPQHPTRNQRREDRPALRFVLGLRPEPPQQQLPQQPQPAGENVQQNAAAVAEHTININSTSMGRLLGGALIIPDIANVMGSLLFRLSAHSVLLRKFLAIRPRRLKIAPSLERWEGPTWSSKWEGLGFVAQIGLAFKFAFSHYWLGSRTWADCDPVW